MKKLLLPALLFFMVFISKETKACNYTGVRLYYTAMGGSTYNITFVFYRDCSAINAPAYINLNFKCSSNSAFNFTASLPEDTSLTREVTPVSTDATTHCSSGSLFGVEEHVYHAMVTMVPCDHWTISYVNCCRMAADNVYGTENTYIEALCDNLNAPGSSSPVFALPSLWVAQKDRLLNFNPAVYDPDGDSLSFDFYAPMTNNQSTTVSYKPGFSAVNFISSSVPVSIDHATGQMTLKPNALQFVEYGIKVTKWRKVNGVMKVVGRVYDDIMLKTYDASNHYPLLSGMIFDGSFTYSPSDTVFFTEAQANKLLEFNIAGYDPDTLNPSINGHPEKFTISKSRGFEPDTFIVYHNGTDSAVATFRWRPSLDKIRTRPYYFIVQVRDSAYGYNALQRYTYAVRVVAPELNLGNDTVICTTQTITLDGDSGNYSYLWSTGDTTRKIVVDGSTLSPGTYSYSLIRTGYGKTDYDTINITVSTCAGINAAVAADMIRIIPNPNDGRFVIRCQNFNYAAVRMKVFSARNKLLLDKRLKPVGNRLDYHVDLSFYPAGIYFIIFQVNDTLFSKKLIIK